MQKNVFYVNLKNEEFTLVYQNINKVFNGNYLTYITEIKKNVPYLVDIVVLLRKYQYYFQSICVNNSNLCCFDEKEFSNNLLSLKNFLSEESVNTFVIRINLLPKFKVNELPFDIPTKLLKLKMTLKANWKASGDFRFESCEIEALNLIDVFSQEKYMRLNKLLSKIFSLILSEYTTSPFQGLNAFLNHIENFFPEMFKQEDKDALIQKNFLTEVWDQDEQNKLEELITKYKSLTDIREKMQRISEELKTKSLKQITKRYKELLLEYSQKKNNEENEKKQQHSFNSEEKVTENKKMVIEEKKLIQDNEQYKSLSLNSTDDIINEIIRVYQEKYANEILIEIDNKKQDSAINDTSQTDQIHDEKKEVNNDKEEEEDEDEDGEGEEANEDTIEEMNIKTTEKNMEILNIYLSTNLQPSLSSEDIHHLHNILNFGDKFQINIVELSMFNIGLANLIAIKLLLKCSTCKKVAFESNYQKIDKSDGLFYMGTRCPRCDNEMFSLFKPEYLHEQNQTITGVVYMIGCFVVDFLPSTFALSCLKCQDIKKVKLRSGNLHFKDSKCHKCFAMLEFRFQSVNISPTFESDLSFLQNCNIINFAKYNHVIKDDIDLDNYVKKVHKGVQEGKPLPLFGTCLHYKKSFRWFRFSCCHKLFPCDNCHNENSEHELEIAKTILCGYCAFEQVAMNKICSRCGSCFTQTMAGNGFWEGGKGCRNKSFMSSKDSHKYTDSKLKTISKKKREKLEKGLK